MGLRALGGGAVSFVTLFLVVIVRWSDGARVFRGITLFIAVPISIAALALSKGFVSLRGGDGVVLPDLFRSGTALIGGSALMGRTRLAVAIVGGLRRLAGKAGGSYGGGTGANWAGSGGELGPELAALWNRVAVVAAGVGNLGMAPTFALGVVNPLPSKTWTRIWAAEARRLGSSRAIGSRLGISLIVVSFT